jgi:CheY-like chemotaxis protein
LLDIDLQTGLDGFDFLVFLRAHPKGRLTPVIMLTESTNLEHIERGYSAGANAFTQKPFSFADWLTYLKQLRTYWFETATLPKK